jgi:hypothetical protein
MVKESKSQKESRKEKKHTKESKETRAARKAAKAAKTNKENKETVAAPHDSSVETKDRKLTKLQRRRQKVAQLMKSGSSKAVYILGRMNAFDVVGSQSFKKTVVSLPNMLKVTGHNDIPTMRWSDASCKALYDLASSNTVQTLDRARRVAELNQKDVVSKADVLTACEVLDHRSRISRNVDAALEASA